MHIQLLSSCKQLASTPVRQPTGWYEYRHLRVSFLMYSSKKVKHELKTSIRICLKMQATIHLWVAYVRVNPVVWKCSVDIILFRDSSFLQSLCCPYVAKCMQILFHHEVRKNKLLLTWHAIGYYWIIAGSGVIYYTHNIPLFLNVYIC